MKLCKDCAKFKESIWCCAPENGTSPLNGRPQPMFATERRSEPGDFFGHDRCGPEAKYFAPKMPQKRAWWKFWEGTKQAPSNA